MVFSLDQKLIGLNRYVRTDDPNWRSLKKNLNAILLRAYFVRPDNNNYWMNGKIFLVNRVEKHAPYLTADEPKSTDTRLFSATDVCKDAVLSPE